MSEPELAVRWPRPTRLSDPFNDNAPVALAELLAKPDDRLDGVDYRILFGPRLPAGTFEEVVYFLPHAIDYLAKDDGLAAECLSSVVGWVDENSPRLGSEGLFAPVVRRFRSLLDRWGGEFVVDHFDQEACRRKGWRCGYYDLVRRSDSIQEMLDALARADAFADVADRYVGDLARNDTDAVKAAWFLELARARSDGPFRPPKRSVLAALLGDRAIQEAAAQVVVERTALQESSPTYWNDVFLRLGL